jgi:hypothetical protein
MTSPAHHIARLLLLGATRTRREYAQERGKVGAHAAYQYSEQLDEMESPPPLSEEDREGGPNGGLTHERC